MLHDLQRAEQEASVNPRTRRKHVFAVTENISTWRAVADVLDDKNYLLKRYTTPPAFLAEDHPFRTGCILVDASPESGLSFLERIKPACGRLTVIILSASANIQLAVLAARAGAFDVLRTPIDQIEIESGVNNALDSLRVVARIDDDTTAAAIAALSANAAFDSLTTRQVEILGSVVQGRSNKAIAAHLGISLRTAENHRAAAMRKLGVSSISELVRAAATITPWRRPSRAF